jgi:hypothetical protein
MKIELKEIPISEVTKGYKDSADEGVKGYNGWLNIRPAFQREFIYKDKQRDNVLNTIRKNFPLNVMYWTESANGKFELLDGQQRTISFCQYVNGEYSIDFQYFHNLTDSEKQQILDYKLMVYICEGTDKERLDWFRTINIAGMQLTPQELRNAIYTGEWLTEAKKYFSKTGCPAYNIGEDYLKGSAIRQDYLETVIGWLATKEGKEIEDYMSIHQHDTNANEIWLYFNSVITWVKVLFPNYRREMKGVEWGILYNEFKDKTFDAKQLEQSIQALMMDDDVSNKKGAYSYVLTRNEKYLSIRTFSESQKRESYERQKGICPACGKHFEIQEMEADHIIPWHLGGKTVAENCQMLCKSCNRTKSGK